MVSCHRLSLLFLVLLLLLQLNHFFSSKLLCVIHPSFILWLKIFFIEIHNFPVIALHIEHLLLLSLCILCLAARTGSNIVWLVLRVLLFWEVSWMRGRLVDEAWRFWIWYAFRFSNLLLLKLKKCIRICNLWLLIYNRGIWERLKTLYLLLLILEVLNISIIILIDFFIHLTLIPSYLIIRCNVPMSVLSYAVIDRNTIILRLVNPIRLIILKINPIHIDVGETLWFLNSEISHIISHYFFTQFSYFTRIILLTLNFNMYLWLVVAYFTTAFPLMSLLLCSGRPVFNTAALAGHPRFPPLRYLTPAPLTLSLICFRSSYLNLRYLYGHYLYLLRCTRRQLKDHFLN